MNRENFSFEGLAEIEARILRLSDDADYLIIQDRTVPKSDETVARFDLNDACALPYLDDAPDPEAPRDDGVGAEGFFDGSDAGDDQGDGHTDAPDDGPDPEAEVPEPRIPTEPLARPLLCRAACRWMRDVARRNTVGEEWRRFRVRVYGPKGHRLLDSGQFVCRNHDFDLHLPIGGESAPVPAPVPDFEVAASVGGSKAIKALGEYYARFGQIVLGTVGQLQGVNNATISRLHRDLERSRDQVEELVASILTHRFNEVQAAETRRIEEKDGDARTVLARDALNKLGDAARAFLVAQGISPEMSQLVGVLGQSPELMGVLKDPDVQALMSDPGNLKIVAGMLKQVGIQAKAMKVGGS